MSYPTQVYHLCLHSPHVNCCWAALSVFGQWDSGISWLSVQFVTVVTRGSISWRRSRPRFHTIGLCRVSHLLKIPLESGWDLITFLAVWVSIVGLPVFLVNTAPQTNNPPFGFTDYLGLGLLVGSFAFEVVADYQKNEWRRAKSNKQHEEKFITSGLWSISRHPKYEFQRSDDSIRKLIMSTIAT